MIKQDANTERKTSVDILSFLETEIPFSCMDII
jgi:hypothetical protein